MSRYLLALACVGVLAACACSMRGQDQGLTRKLLLIDAGSKQTRAGIVRLRGADGKIVPVPGAIPRLLGVKVAEEFDGWHVVPASGMSVTLPPGRYRGEAVAGLETLATPSTSKCVKPPRRRCDVTLPTCFDPGQRGLVAGNTHLHLMKITRQQAEDYLKHVPAADGLRVMFISYLERFKDDAEYITNRYPVGDLPELSKTGVLFNNGQEHRHNFGGYGEGYGHVMFLNIKNLVKPVSLGPGITGAGVDDRPLRPGIDEARQQGGTIVWCHNASGHEDVPSAVTGRLDALNVFDGSRRGGFEETYYRFLNIGLRLPISTGTDWFMYDFARVYAKVDGPLTTQSWLVRSRRDATQITNGPLVTLTVDGQESGATLKLERAAHAEDRGERHGPARFPGAAARAQWQGHRAHQGDTRSHDPPCRIETRSPHGCSRLVRRPDREHHQERAGPRAVCAHLAGVRAVRRQSALRRRGGRNAPEASRRWPGRHRPAGEVQHSRGRRQAAALYDEAAQNLRRQLNAPRSTSPRARRTRTFPFARTPKTVTLPSVSRTLPK